MAANLRREALAAFKALHKIRLKVFDGHAYALQEGRQKINEEFKKNKHVKDPDAIKELIEHSKAIENELRTNVIQAKEVEPGRYEAKIGPETTRLDNVPFDESCVRLEKKQKT